MFKLKGSIPNIVDAEAKYATYVVAQHYALYFAREFAINHIGTKFSPEFLIRQSISIVDEHDAGLGVIYLGQIVNEIETEYIKNHVSEKIELSVKNPGKFSPKVQESEKEYIRFLNEIILRDEKKLNLEFYAAEEGERFLKSHIKIERSKKIVRLKKQSAMLKLGHLSCEVCGFNFFMFYGAIGQDFCEVHHRSALHEQSSPVRTSLEDLAILCANCHRMIHRTKPLASVEEFRTFFLEHQIVEITR
jgi:HNH endonuclease